MPDSHALRLGDLSDAELETVFRAVPCAERPRLACVCRRWRAICAGGDVWRSAELNLTRGWMMRRDEEGTADMLAWFAARRGSIRELTVVAQTGAGTAGQRCSGPWWRRWLVFLAARQFWPLLADSWMYKICRQPWGSTRSMPAWCHGSCPALCRRAGMKSQPAQSLLCGAAEQDWLEAQLVLGMLCGNLQKLSVLAGAEGCALLAGCTLSLLPVDAALPCNTCTLGLLLVPSLQGGGRLGGCSHPFPCSLACSIEFNMPNTAFLGAMPSLQSLWVDFDDAHPVGPCRTLPQGGAGGAGGIVARTTVGV